MTALAVLTVLAVPESTLPSFRLSYLQNTGSRGNRDGFDGFGWSESDESDEFRDSCARFIASSSGPFVVHFWRITQCLHGHSAWQWLWHYVLVKFSSFTIEAFMNSRFSLFSPEIHGGNESCVPILHCCYGYLCLFCPGSLMCISVTVLVTAKYPWNLICNH